MTDVLERLRAALADRYRIEREIGRSGTATVYLAEDELVARGKGEEPVHLVDAKARAERRVRQLRLQQAEPVGKRRVPIQDHLRSAYEEPILRQPVCGSLPRLRNPQHDD
jgi:hypothetical protein